VTQMFRITLSAALMLVVAAALAPCDTRAQSGLRFNPGGLTPSMPYSTSGSILDLMPAPTSEAATSAEPTAAKPEPAPETAVHTSAAPTTATEPSEPTLHQGLSPEKANPAAGLSPTRGAAPAQPPMSPDSSAGEQSPYLAPSPYTTPRSPGGGLRVR
jgi:hypothetical protein